MESYLSDTNRLVFEHNHNNKPIAEIARENGVHPGVVYRLFKRLGMKVNKHTRPPTEDHTNKKCRDACSRKCLHASDQAAIMRSKREETSEWENCFNHAILRLWDCGKLKFTQDNI